MIAVEAGKCERTHGNVDRNAGVDLGEATAHVCLFFICDEFFFELSAYVVDMCVYAVHALVCPKQPQRRFLTNARHAWDIVGTVAHKALQVYDLGRNERVHLT